MSKIKFKLDDVSKDFNLIAIRSDVEDYRMVYFLNKKLNINLSRRNNDIVFYKDENKYSIYDYTDESRYLKWIFFSNKSFSRCFHKEDRHFYKRSLFNKRTCTKAQSRGEKFPS